MTTSKEDVFKAILEERSYQDRKWGSIEKRPHTIAEWILIAEAELEEAKRAWTKDCSDIRALEELLQTAAVIFAALEQHSIEVSYYHWWKESPDKKLAALSMGNARHYGLNYPGTKMPGVSS